MRKSTVALAIAGAMVVGSAGFLAGTTAEPDPAPAARLYTPPAVSCPAEDSCQVDWADHGAGLGWYLRTYDDHSQTPPGPWVRVSR